MKKHVLATLFLSTLFAATAWAQDSGETTVRRYSGFGPTTGVVKWTVKQYDGLQAVDVTNAMYMPWDSAVEFCRQNFGGHGGWRLANRRDAERFVKAKDVKSGMFWIDERNTYYFVYPSTPVDIRVMNDPEKSGNDMSPLCVADGAAAQKAQGPRTDAGTGTASATRDEVALANYERLKLERDKPGSSEARDAAARYHAMLGKQKVTAEDVAMANYERLKAQRDNPGSTEAREAEARYNAMRGQQAKNRDGATVSKDELAMANYERLRLAREKPESSEAREAESGYQAMLQASRAQDKSKAKASPDTPARMLGPILTRVEPKQPSAEEGAAQKKSQEADRKRKADEAAALKARQADDAAKAKVREDAARASCMKPENRGVCSCLRFFPKEKGSNCGK